MWVIYSLAVNTIFQTFVSSFLVDPGLQKQINTVDGILQAGIGYGVYRTFLGLLPDLPKHQRDVIFNHTDGCAKIVVCAKKVAKEGNYATVLAGITAEYLNTYETQDDTGAGLLYIVNEMKLWTNFQVFLLPVGSPFLSAFNRILRVAQEAGLVSHFWEDTLTASTIKSGSIRIHTLLDDYRVFTLAYLQGAFYLLILGYCFAFCMLSGELTYHWWVSRRRAKLLVNFKLKRRRTRRGYYP
jgi:hypothetical protein